LGGFEVAWARGEARVPKCDSSTVLFWTAAMASVDFGAG